MAEVVISGISGRFPESRDVAQLWENLSMGVDMVTEDGRRWKPGLWDLPRRNGKLLELSKFDAEFFEVHGKQAANMDPMLRILLEVTYEAIVNAGVAPSKLAGSRTGVWIGVSGSETVEALSADTQNMEGYVITGCSTSMFANRISFFYDFKGPSLAIDTACSSSLMAMHLARQAIANGDCEAAIVGGAHLVLKPHLSMQFKKLNMLSPDGACKAFDENANGYVRSEAVAAIYLCKKDVARRVYCDIVNSRCSSDGRKEAGITFPSGYQQKLLLEETYGECGVNPSEVFYVEAHGTGTKAGDPQEVGALDHVMCADRKEPLLIGSIKSNMGHSEPASGLCGVIKCCLAAHHRQLPPNLHITNINPKIDALREGRIKPVVEMLDLPDRSLIMGVNSFGFGGSNVHVILRTNQESPSTDRDSSPTICLLTARTEEGMNKKFQQSPVFEAIFLNGISDIPIQRHPYRGYVIDMGNDDAMVEEQEWCKVTRTGEVCFVFSGMGSQWKGMGKDLLRIPTFAVSIAKCSDALRNYGGIDVANLLQSADNATYTDIVNSFVGLVAVQIGLLDVLTSLKIHCDVIVGHSVGELACAYADGCLTLEQTIQAAYVRGSCVKQAALPRGGMAAVGLTWKECLEECTLYNVAPACHNAQRSVTVTGREEDVIAFVTSLKEKEIFAKMVETGGVAFHSKYMELVYPQFLAELQKIIPTPKRRSHKWKSTSSPKNGFVGVSSAEYHANNLRSPVLFHDKINQLPDNAVVIEVAPHCLLRAILRRSLPSAAIVGLCNKNEENGVKTLMAALGKLHCSGVDMEVNNLFGHATPNPLSCDLLVGHMDWEHDCSWFVPSPYHFFASSSGGKPTESSFKIDTKSGSDDHYLRHHVINGQLILPATALLRLAWQTFSNYLETALDNLGVQFDDVTIYGATFLGKKELQINVQYNPALETFTITQEGRLVATGKIKALEGEISQPQRPTGSENVTLDKQEVYKKLRLSGYQYGDEFQLVFDADTKGNFGRIEWKDNYTTFMDAVLHFSLIKSHDHHLRLPTRIGRIRINPFPPTLETPSLVDVIIDANRILAGGQVEVVDLHVTKAPKRINFLHTYVKAKRFFPNFYDVQDNDVTSYVDVIRSYCQADEMFKKASLVQCNEVEASDAAKTFWRTQPSSTLLHAVIDLVENRADLPRNPKEPLLSDWSINYCLLNEEIFTSTIGIAASELMFDVRIGLYPSDQLDIDKSLSNMAENHLQSIPNCIYRCFTLPKSKKTILFGAPSSDDECNLLFANEIFFAGLERGRSIIREMAERLCSGTSFVMLHHTCGGNFIQDLRDHVSKEFDSSYARSDVTVEQITSELEMINFRLVAHKQQKDCGSHLLLFQKEPSLASLNEFIVEIGMRNFDWIKEVKLGLASHEKDVWLVARDNLNGADEFAENLRRETGSNRIRCVSNCSLDSAKNLPKNLAEVLERRQVTNVFVDGKWGSFQHVSSNKPKPIATERSYLMSSTPGDLTSLTWVKLPRCSIDKTEYKTAYAALNFRDVMLASGKLASEAIPGDPDKCRTLLGLEFSGYDYEGTRVMGIVPGDGFSTHVTLDAEFTWKVPEKWSLEEAATVPVVYSTAYYALIVRGQMKKGESVLVHCGAGGVGQAAITIALSRGCTVFATVSSQEKRDFLKKRFPALKDENFAQSRDSSFERTILKRTGGRGVDLVLNSLSGDLLFAGVRCLAKHGRFLEIGKYDLIQNSKLGMFTFLKNTTFHGILLDSLFGDVTDEWRSVRELVRLGIETGEVKPLPHRIFQKNDVESAFRFMSQGSHIGKVLVDVTDKGDHVNERISFDPALSYVITGGLGGFGLELCDWVIGRGARKLIITSRSGLTTAYQKQYVAQWQSRGASVTISNSDVSTTEGACELLDESTGGIFHLAMVLRDGMFENQTKESFESVCRTKCDGIINLDKFSRVKCPNLSFFVAFSSMASRNSTKGQSNYVLANSVMEQVCRVRHRDALPAVAVQWGAIADVGIAANKFGDAAVGGTDPQSIASCLESLDELLLQGEPVVACYIIKEKSRGPDTAEKSETPALAVAKILGIMDVSKINEDASLLSLGADSLMTTEIIQFLQRECSMSVDPKSVRNLTFAELMTYRTKQERKGPEVRKFQRMRSSNSLVSSVS